jgi:hypothetical protein
MDPAPVLTGLASKKISTPQMQRVNESDYAEQAREFAAVTNFRNRNGRNKADLQGKDPAVLLESAKRETYVVEFILSGLIDRPLQQMNIAPEKVSKLVEEIDIDHSHFQIPGTFVQDVLDEGHAEFANVKPNQKYLLSVFDMRDYNCDGMEIFVRDYFNRSSKPEKDRLHNSSIYVISQIDFNSAPDLEQASKLFGKKPDAIVVQKVIYADHLVRAGKTIFAFYSEGSKTRIALLSNIALKKSYFEGGSSTVTKDYILNGFKGSLQSKAISAVVETYQSVSGKKAATQPNSQLSNRAQQARKTDAASNTCQRGLALGLIRYSQSLFKEFVTFTTK